MTDDQWPPEVSDFYKSLTLNDGPRESISQMRDAILEARRWKRIAGALAAACVAFAAIGTAFVVNQNANVVVNQGAKPGGVEHPVNLPDIEYQLVAVRIHRDWCGRCKKMGNVFAELQQDLNGKQVLFLTFDLTDSETTRESLLISDQLKISNVLKGIESGNIVLLNRDGQLLQTLDGTAGKEYLANQIAMRL